MAKKKIYTTVKVDEKTGDGFIELEAFKDLVDITKVASYSLEPVLDKNKVPVGIIVKFYDEAGKEIIHA